MQYNYRVAKLSKKFELKMCRDEICTFYNKDKGISKFSICIYYSLLILSENESRIPIFYSLTLILVILVERLIIRNKIIKYKIHIAI